ncbi:MAG: nucleotidyltransferase [Solobacterium sp.]|nr:nucleotidyltransferase [Solobacterium sp.]MDY2952725.1 nucleotidyltransferase [Erysipelotrichaceae bacterium]
MTKEEMLNDFYTKIAKEISITKPMIEKAEESYQAVGKWINDGIDNNVQFTVQGSMGLGTTIKPISDEDDYDIDLVCVLKDGQNLTAKEIKNIVGNRLKENEIYRKKIESEGEGKRCWKMQYNQFHMDILPCVPKTYYLEPNYTDIRLTHKNEYLQYEDRFSNPEKYKVWFISCTEDMFVKNRQIYADEYRVDIQKVPFYKIKTPLQMAIQLLKRHRDMCFEDNVDNAPISIIITTLAAKAYKGEENVYEALVRLLNHMQDYVENRDGVYWIENPVMSEENFADKWEEYPERRKAFYEWINKAKEDLLAMPLKTQGIHVIGNKLGKVLGEAPVKRALSNMAEDTKKTRDDGRLFMAGLTKGLTKDESESVVTVKKHTFYGK